MVNDIWLRLVDAFSKHVNKDLVEVDSSKKRGSREAKLHADITAVRQLLTNASMGIDYDAPGEWAAALRALFVERVLIGNPTSITNWAVEQKYIKPNAYESIKKVWGEERSEASAFVNDNQKTVFRTVSSAARKLLANK